MEGKPCDYITSNWLSSQWCKRVEKQQIMEGTAVNTKHIAISYAERNLSIAILSYKVPLLWMYWIIDCRKLPT
jgi:hypothetical protein